MKLTPLQAGVRRATVRLWWIGAALAAATAVLSVAQHKTGFALVYATVAVALAAMATRTRRGERWAEMVSLVGLGAQIPGAIGAAWALVADDEGSAKARHLHDLGVNYRAAVAANLAYSLAAAAVFVWAVAGRHQRPGGPEGRRRP
jgi:hypothetical protein